MDFPYLSFVLLVYMYHHFYTNIQHSSFRCGSRKIWQRITLCPQYAISQLRIVCSGLHLITYLDVDNFCDKSTETTLHKMCVQVFLRFSDSSKPSQFVSLIYELAWLAGVRQSKENLLKTSSFLLWPKFPTYFDDAMTIENHRQCVWILMRG